MWRLNMKESVEVLQTRLKRELMCIKKTSGGSESVFIRMLKSLTPQKYFIYIYIHNAKKSNNFNIFFSPLNRQNGMTLTSTEIRDFLQRWNTHCQPAWSNWNKACKRYNCGHPSKRHLIRARFHIVTEVYVLMETIVSADLVCQEYMNVTLWRRSEICLNSGTHNSRPSLWIPWRNSDKVRIQKLPKRLRAIPHLFIFRDWKGAHSFDAQKHGPCPRMPFYTMRYDV